jgi:hypothetical protein
MTVQFGSFTEARTNLKTLLDAAERGHTATVHRGDPSHTAAVVDADRLRQALALLCVKPQALAEDGGWSLFFDDLPVGADGPTIDEAVEDTIAALRDHAEDWEDHLYLAPNHAGHWGYVQLINLSTDAQLREWMTGLPLARTGVAA